MGIVSAFQLPHPPIMVEEVGGIETKKVKKSIEAANRVGREIKELARNDCDNIFPWSGFYRCNMHL